MDSFYTFYSFLMQLLLKNHFIGVTNKLFLIYLFIYLLFEWALYRLSRDVSFINSAPFIRTLKGYLTCININAILYEIKMFNTIVSAQKN